MPRKKKNVDEDLMKLEPENAEEFDDDIGLFEEELENDYENDSEDDKEELYKSHDYSTSFVPELDQRRRRKYSDFTKEEKDLLKRENDKGDNVPISYDLVPFHDIVSPRYFTNDKLLCTFEQIVKDIKSESQYLRDNAMVLAYYLLEEFISSIYDKYFKKTVSNLPPSNQKDMENELLCVGKLAMIKVLPKYNINHVSGQKTSYTTYFFFNIRGDMSKYIQKNIRKIPANQSANINKMLKIDELYNRKNEKASIVDYFIELNFFGKDNKGSFTMTETMNAVTAKNRAGMETNLSSIMKVDDGEVVDSIELPYDKMLMNDEHHQGSMDLARPADSVAISNYNVEKFFSLLSSHASAKDIDIFKRIVDGDKISEIANDLHLTANEVKDAKERIVGIVSKNPDCIKLLTSMADKHHAETTSTSWGDMDNNNERMEDFNRAYDAALDEECLTSV